MFHITLHIIIKNNENYIISLWNTRKKIQINIWWNQNPQKNIEQLPIIISL
jgi:hypothetical protein